MPVDTVISVQPLKVDNNTTTLVADCERIRTELSVEKWGVVLGGSWGSTLALALAETHPTRVRSLLLRGVFLFGPDEVDYLFSTGGTFGQHPQAWTKYSQFIQDTSSDWERERTNLLGAYYSRLTGGDAAIQNAAASAFVAYELSISKTFTDSAGQCIPFFWLTSAVFCSRGGFDWTSMRGYQCRSVADIRLPFTR
jgi:proline iminopeptidase